MKEAILIIRLGFFYNMNNLTKHLKTHLTTKKANIAPQLNSTVDS